MINAQYAMQYRSTDVWGQQTMTSSLSSSKNKMFELYDRLHTLSSGSMDSQTPISDEDMTRFVGRLRDQDVMFEIRRQSERSGKSSKKSKDRVGFGRRDKSLNVSFKSRRSFANLKCWLNADETSVFDHSEKPGVTRLMLQDFINHRSMVKKINMLKYRENVFRAATRLAKEMPPFPDWTYEDEDLQYLEITKINVGGRIFHIFENTLMNLIHTKLAKCIKSHKSEGVPFFDRDSVCFAAVIQFYRTGQLHKPANICDSFFDEELEFWGIKEQFMESCCWTAYDSFKTSTKTLKKYDDDMNKFKRADNKSDTAVLRCKERLYKIMTVGSDSVLSKLLSLISILFIIVSIINIFMSSSPIARIDDKTKHYSELGENELLSHFLKRTDISPKISLSELLVTGYFLSEIVIKLILSHDKLEFFSDTFNWIDLMYTLTSLITSRVIWPKVDESLECYIMFLKIPRILSLFKLSTRLRNGTEAFIRTFRASVKELQLIFLVLVISISVFGSLFFVVEMTNETTSKRSRIKSIYMGMWLALETISSVGYGDIHIKSGPGYCLGFVCIICGVVMCRMQVPLFLEKFITYYHQANARLNYKPKLSIRHIDPESLHKPVMEVPQVVPHKEIKNRLFKKLFYPKVM